MFDKINDFFMNLFIEGIKANTNMGYSFFGDLANHSILLLKQSPKSWNSDGWNFIAKTNVVFIGVGSALIVLFFLMSFCMESIDIKQEIRMENILIMFIKLSLASFLVVNSFSIIQTAFGFVDALIPTKLSNTNILGSIPNQIELILKDPGKFGLSGGSAFGIWLFSFIHEIILIGCGLLICLQAYMRFFKILLIIPYGSLANSTVAGGHMLQQSAVSFWKFALCSILEAVTMIMALQLCSIIISGGKVNLFPASSGPMLLMGWMIQNVFLVVVTVGTIKGASSITQRALNL